MDGYNITQYKCGYSHSWYPDTHPIPAGTSFVCVSNANNKTPYCWTIAESDDKSQYSMPITTELFLFSRDGIIYRLAHKSVFVSFIHSILFLTWTSNLILLFYCLILIDSNECENSGMTNMSCIWTYSLLSFDNNFSKDG